MIRFTCSGNKNILGNHKTTLEFIKDKNLTKKGNCIIGINCNFDLNEIKDYIKNKNKLKIIIRINNLKEEINANINQKFNSKSEIVIRKTDFISERTLATNANKAAIDINRKWIELMKNPDNKMEGIIK